jgi:hypothetical protein
MAQIKESTNKEEKKKKFEYKKIQTSGINFGRKEICRSTPRRRKKKNKKTKKGNRIFFVSEEYGPIA